MRRRHLLALSAGALAAPALIAQPARAAVETRELHGYRIRTFSVRPGSGSHDVACNADGSVWFSGQRDGTLNLLDPRDGGLKVVNLGPGAAPHGVVVGPDGAAWVTEGGQNAIARVDPADHRVQLWKLNGGPANANLNTLVFDKQGMLWFTGQGGAIGRFEPKTEKMQVWDAPRGYGPYGIARHPPGHRLVRVAGRQLSRRDRPRDGHAAHRRATDAAAGRPPRVVRQPGTSLDQRMEQRQRLDARSEGRKLEEMEAAGRAAAHLLGLCRRPRRGLADRLLGQCHRALRSQDRNVPLPFRPTSRAPTCARWPDGRARPGAASRAPTAWSSSTSRKPERMRLIVAAAFLAAAGGARAETCARRGFRTLPGLPCALEGRWPEARSAARRPDRPAGRGRSGVRLFADPAGSAREGRSLDEGQARPFSQRSRGAVCRHLDGQPANPRREAARRPPVCSGRPVG